ncbi:hypothetical protein I5907_13745 [Panacibacter sp. DH6]|uniref:YCII-related domain-containing protein n=1 Tax=Panacibacter microcysteis TaxID=2793269 RepID=A0A931E8L9_9BACT|nr:YciI family protein [Panacibacter microcysteis]MBG9377300.1 hypothetical protein [Panacibacter microcysteis]
MPQFLILATDYKDEQALTRRLQVREVHLARMRTEKEKAVFIFGGARLNASGNMCGSMLVIALPDISTVEQWIEEDPYIKGKVWESVEILPFKTAAV